MLVSYWCHCKNRICLMAETRDRESPGICYFPPLIWNGGLGQGFIFLAVLLPKQYFLPCRNAGAGKLAWCTKSLAWCGRCWKFKGLFSARTGVKEKCCFVSLCLLLSVSTRNTALNTSSLSSGVMEELGTGWAWEVYKGRVAHLVFTWRHTFSWHGWCP